MSDCDQLVVGMKDMRDALGETLDLLVTDVPGLVQVSVAATIGNSDHSSVQLFRRLRPQDHSSVQLLCVSRKVFLKVN